MCGRYALSQTPEELREHFRVPAVPAFAANLDVRPTNLMPVIHLSQTGERQCTLMRWGLIPSWAKERTIASKLFNARAETIATLPSFRSAFRKRHCLVPASHFYEWMTLPDGRKRKYGIGLTDERLFAFAGLHEWWQSPEGEEILSFTIITCRANELIRPIHAKNRMPVIVSPEHYARWLDLSAPNAYALLMPYATDEMVAEPA